MPAGSIIRQFAYPEGNLIGYVYYDSFYPQGGVTYEVQAVETDQPVDYSYVTGANDGVADGTDLWPVFCYLDGQGAQTGTSRRVRAISSSPYAELVDTPGDAECAPTGGGGGGGGGVETCPLQISSVQSADLRTLTFEPVAGTYTGPLRYSKNGGQTWQDSNVFQLRTAVYDFVVEDTGYQAQTPGFVCAVTQHLDNQVPGDDGTGPDPNGGSGVEPPVNNGLPLPATLIPAALHQVEAATWLTSTGWLAGQLVQLDLVVERTAHRSADYAPLLTARKYADETGTAYFRVDEQLRSSMRREAPRDNNQFPYFDAQCVRNFYGIFSRVRSTGALISTTTTALQTATLAMLAKPGNWCTSQPNPKTVALGEPEFLYFQLGGGTPPANLRVCRQATLPGPGGVSQAPPVFYQDFATAASGRPAAYRMLVVPIYSPGLPANALRFDLWLETSDGVRLSPTRTFALRTRGAETARSFLFASPYGGVDTLTTTGVGTAKITADSETASRGRQPADTLTSEQDFLYQVEGRRSFKVTSGWLNPAQKKWLQGFVIARKVWLRRAGALLPIVPTKRELTYETDLKQLDALTFEFTLASDLAALAEL